MCQHLFDRWMLTNRLNEFQIPRIRSPLIFERAKDEKTYLESSISWVWVAQVPIKSDLVQLENKAINIPSFKLVFIPAMKIPVTDLSVKPIVKSGPESPFVFLPKLYELSSGIYPIVLLHPYKSDVTKFARNSVEFLDNATRFIVHFSFRRHIVDSLVKTKLSVNAMRLSLRGWAETTDCAPKTQ